VIVGVIESRFGFGGGDGGVSRGPSGRGFSIEDEDVLCEVLDTAPYWLEYIVDCRLARLLLLLECGLVGRPPRGIGPETKFLFEGSSFSATCDDFANLA
jgi:hypothetical protein